MKPALANLRYFLADAWDEWRHSPGVNLLAMTTLSMALFLAGLLLLMLFNVEERVERLEEELRVEIYLAEGVDAEARARLQERLEAIDGVVDVRYVGKDEALRRFRRSFGDLAGLPAELGANPLPASFEVLLRSDAGARETARLIVATMTGEPGVEEARFDREWLERIQALLGLARWGGVGLTLVVFAAVAFVMASVLRLAVYARRDEIEIMLLVGATPAFVRGPFLVAGVGQGLIASGVAMLLVEGARRLALAYAGSTAPLALLELVAGRPLSAGLAVLLLLIGVVVGATGAWFAVRGHSAFS